MESLSHSDHPPPPLSKHTGLHGDAEEEVVVMETAGASAVPVNLTENSVGPDRTQTKVQCGF